MLTLVLVMCLATSSAYAADSTRSDLKGYKELMNYTSKDGTTHKKSTYINENGQPVYVDELNRSIVADPSKWTLLANREAYYSSRTLTGKEFKFPYPQIQAYSTGKSDAYSDSNHTNRFSIDKIGVITKLYRDDAILNTASETQNKSSSAAATAWQNDITCCNFNYKGYTNHTYENAGFEGWYPVTWEHF